MQNYPAERPDFFCLKKQNTAHMIMSNCRGGDDSAADAEGKGTENPDGNRIDRIQADCSHVPVHVCRICDVQN
jgi:hypothetical protein